MTTPTPTTTPNRAPSAGIVDGVPDAALEVTDLTVRYGATTAVDRASFDARRGEILGLLGPNGAGKTSVIRALTTIVPIDGGTATIAGVSIGRPHDVRARIGVLPESNGYPTSQTGPAYLRYYGRLFGLDRADADARGRKLLDQMGLGGNRDRIATYSRGMRQRLGLARALVNRPEVLFLDEPTLGLDPAGKEDILGGLARTAADDGTCVVLCSHLLDEVERVCDRVAIMHEGRIVAAGTVDHVIAESGTGGRGRIRVAPHDVVVAERTLRSTGAVLATVADDRRPGELDLELAPEPEARRSLLRALLDAGVEPTAFDLAGARLSDAFLALTGAGSNRSEAS